MRFFSKILCVLVLTVSFTAHAYADFYFEQNVHTSEKRFEKHDIRSTQAEFKRKIYALDGLLSIQIEDNGRLQKEYGFDFTKKLYYEADPQTGYYKLFDLELLASEFNKADRIAPSFKGSRSEIARDVSRVLLEGAVDYPVRVQKTFFGKKKFDGRSARLYQLRAGPGSNFLNPFGWYHKAELWATEDVPGFSEYAALRDNLRSRAAFYKIKHNRVSDFLTTIAALGALPLRIDSVIRRTDRGVTVLETSAETTSYISTAPVDLGQLLYVGQRPRFSWDVVFSKGTVFGREVSPKRGMDFSMRRSLPWLVIPVIFLISSWLWYFGGYAAEDEFSLKRVLVLRIYIFFAALLALEGMHFLKGIPFLVSPIFETAIGLTVGIFWIVWEARNHLRGVKIKMQERFLCYCPHCRARIETFYVVCPKCNRSISDHVPGDTLEK